MQMRMVWDRERERERERESSSVDVAKLWIQVHPMLMFSTK